MAALQAQDQTKQGRQFPLRNFYETLGLVRLTQLGRDVPWTKA
ncbi:MAG: hypothetical protein ACJ8AH_16315 [Stellaceae bacterium]